MRELAGQRTKLVLADLTVGTSSIGVALGVEPPDSPQWAQQSSYSRALVAGPGIGDALFRGVSLSKVARRLDTESFYFVPSGRPPPSLTALFRHRQWPEIAARFREADAYLFLCVTALDWRRAGPIPGFEASIVLNAAGTDVELPQGAQPLVEIRPPSDAVTKRPRRRGRRRIVFIVAAGVGIPSTFALWKTAGPRQILPDSLALRAAAHTTVAAAAEAPPGRLQIGASTSVARLRERPLPYSVLIASYSSIADALAHSRSGTGPAVPLYVAPTLVRGAADYRVFAGMVPDREGALELMRELVRDGVKETVRDWDVRPAWLAFSFGSFSDAQEADSAVQALRAFGVPAYVVPAAGTGEDEDLAYRVYAGGYENRGDAAPLREQMARSRMDAELVERVGVQRP